MLWYCYNDPTYRMNNGVPIDPAIELTEAVNKGMSYGSKFLEIYVQDVVALPTAISYAHNVLQ